jgi:hypothetical protein
LCFFFDLYFSMMILYIPFLRDEAGDLTHLVQLWQENHLRASGESLIVLYQKDEYDQDLILPGSSLYICAHGYDSPFLEIGNKVRRDEAVRINISTLASRITDDFLPIAYQLSQIHLYCCGSKSKNLSMSQHLQANLLRSECVIVSYSGTITPADIKGRMWSWREGSTVPVERTAIRIFPTPCEESDRRVSLRERSWREEDRMRRHCKFFKERRREHHRALKKDLSTEIVGSALNIY